METLEVGLAELVLTTGWYFWWGRRQHTHGESVQRPSRSAMSMIAALAKNYKEAMKKSSHIRQGWKKPPEGKVRVNVNTSFDADVGCGSVGAIIRDSTGGVLVAAHSYVPHLVDAPMAKAYALKEGLMRAQHIGCNRLIIQSDCIEVVQTMEDGGFTANSAAAIYDECNIIWSDFQDIAIQHYDREANQAAHNLTRITLQSKQNCT